MFLRSGLGKKKKRNGGMGVGTSNLPSDLTMEARDCYLDQSVLEQEGAHD